MARGDASSWRSVALVAMATLAALMAVAVWYVVTAQRARERYLIGRHLRDLAVLAEQLEGTLSAKEAAFDRTAGEPSKEELARLGLRSCAKSELADQAGKGGGGTGITLSARTESAGESTVSLRPESTTHRGWAAKKRTANVEFRHGNANARACASMPLDDVLEPLLKSGDFDRRDVFLAIGEQVFYERGTRSVRLANARFAPSDASPTSGKPAESVRVEDLAATSISRDVEVAGQSFKLFSHPLRLKSPDGSVWWLGVLDPKDEFDTEANTILSYGSVGYGVLGLLLLVLSMPLVKVATMGPRARLRARDIRLLGLSLILVVGGATAFLLGFYADQRLDTELDHDLWQVTQGLRDNFVREIEQVSNALDRFVTGRVRKPPEVEGPQDGVVQPPRLVQLFAKNKDGSRCPQTPESMACCLPDAGCPTATWLEELERDYPYIELLAWTNAAGRQQEKWSMTSTVSDLQGVGDTPYFQDARDGHVWRLPHPTHRQGLSIYVRQSMVWGKILEAVAMPILDDEKRFQGIAAMTPQFVSVSHPVLPTDFSFAIIQNDGRVVFPESQQDRLFQDFFAEGTVASDARAAIEARQERFLGGEYRGVPHRFLVTPIEHSPWTLVVMRNRKKQLSHALDSLLGWFVGFLVYLVLVGLVWGAWRVLARWSPSDWLWPSAGKALQYRQCLLVFVAGCAGATWLLRTAPNVSPAVFAGLLAIIGTCAACARLLLAPRLPAGALMVPAQSRIVWIFLSVVCLAAVIRGTALSTGLGAVLLTVATIQAWRGAEGASTWWRRDVITLGVLALLLAVVVPSAALLRDAWELGMETFVRNGQLKLAERLERLQETNRSEYAEAGIDERLLELRQSDRAEVVPGRIFGGTAAGRAEDATGSCMERDDAPTRFVGPAERLLRLATGSGHVSAPILELLPIRGEDQIQTRELLASSAADRRWAWKRRQDGTAELCWYRPRQGDMPRADDQGRNLSRIASTVPVPGLPAPSDLPERLGVILAALAATGSLWLLLRWLAARIVGLDEEVAHGARRPHEPLHARGVLLIGSACPVAGDRPDADVFDLHAEQAVPTREEALGRIWSAAPVVMVHHVEAALDDPARREQALELLETLAFSQPKPLIVCSEVDPLAYLRQRAQAPGATAPRADATVRWARVLERLSVVPANVSAAEADSLVSLARAVEEADRTGWLWLPTRARAPWSQPELRQLLSETRWTPRLCGIAWETWSFDPPAEGVIRRLEHVASAHYRRLWLQCSEEEQLLLVQLAAEGLVNPRNWRLAHRMARAGVVRFRPAPRLMNESFRRFVAHEEPRAQVVAWERAEGDSLWDRTRGALTYVLIVAGLVLYFTQPEGWAQLVGALSALGSASSKLTDLSGVFGRGRSETGPS